MREPIQVVILGGGTAGWMAAAGLGAMLGPDRCSIRLVESDEIGIVGVGEATLPHMKSFNEMLGIDEAEMMRRTNGTFKLGIEFRDWGYKGSSYIHPFGTFGDHKAGNGFHHQWLRAAQNGMPHPLQDFSFAAAASRRNRFNMPPEEKTTVGSTFSYAYHFDASLYATYLREFAESRGVNRIEGKVREVRLHPETGDVAALVMESGEEVAGDFFIDCSGFRSLLLGQTLKNEWEDWTRWLPCDRAWAVPCQRAGDLTPYTRSTAREAGWQWRIPLQHRTGNGYVFSSAFIGEQESAQVLLANLDGAAQSDPRLLRFAAGRRLKSWSRNCVALGLASGFLEPLESTSIYLIQIAIMNLLPLFPEKRIDPKLVDEFNRRMDLEYERIRDFLILHYYANTRDDAELWRYCRNMEVPDSLRHKIALFKHRGHIEQYKDGLFTLPSWLAVYDGQGIRPERYQAFADNVPISKTIADLEGLKAEIDERVEEMPLHEAYIERYCMSPAAGERAAGELLA